jgi:cilia- and flagella-associated protein 251
MNTSNKSETALKKGTAAINILRIQGKYLVVGASNGSIRFYDFQYRIIAWFEDIDISSITSISFSNEPFLNWEEGSNLPQNEEGKEEDTFTCPEFIVVDLEAKIYALKDSLFREVEREKKKGVLLLKSIVSPIVWISIRPGSNIMALSCENGGIWEWDFKEKGNSLQLLKMFEQEMPTCIDFR